MSGIFIKNVLEGSPAGETGQLCTGDRILEVDGVDLRKASHEKAVDIIRRSGTTVTFVVQVGPLMNIHNLLFISEEVDLKTKQTKLLRQPCNTFYHNESVVYT